MTIGCLIMFVMLVLAARAASALLQKAYSIAEDRVFFFKMLVPITLLTVVTTALFNSELRVYNEKIYFLSMFVFNAITLKTIFCSLTKVG